MPGATRRFSPEGSAKAMASIQSPSARVAGVGFTEPPDAMG